MFFSSLQEVEARLDGLGMFRMRPGLERISLVLENMRLARPPFLTVQVAGTNGKGSVSSFLAFLAQAHGFKTGLHTSPHFVSFRERIRILPPGFVPEGVPGKNGSIANSFAPPELLLEAANEVMANGGECLSYFEFMTAMAVSSFALAKTDVAVMETGLGGTFDATTALWADYVVFTPIALDHCDILGDTLEAIARDKAGAMRRGRPAFSAAQPPEARRALEKEAAEHGVELHFAGEEDIKALPPELLSGASPMRLSGRHQLENAALALKTWRAVAAREALPCRAGQTDAGGLAEAEKHALSEARLPGRFQIVPASGGYPLVHPSLILDGAHNAHGMAALGLELARRGIAPGAVVFSCLADKDPEKLAAHLRSLATGPVFVPRIKDNPRAMEPEALAGLIGLSAKAELNLESALREAVRHVLLRHEVLGSADPDTQAERLRNCPPVLVCGSLYLLGELFALFPELL